MDTVARIALTLCVLYSIASAADGLARWLNPPDVQSEYDQIAREFGAPAQ